MFHVSRLSVYPSFDSDLSLDHYRVDRILDRRLSPGSLSSSADGYEYLVRWFDSSVATWEPYRNLTNSLESVNAYTLLHPLTDSPSEPSDPTPLLSLPSPSHRRTARANPDISPDFAPDPAFVPPPDATPGVLLPSPSTVASPSSSGTSPPPDLSDSSASIPSSPDLLLAPPSSSSDSLPLEWTCGSCGSANHGGSLCSTCGLSRSIFGVDFSSSRVSRSSLPSVITFSRLSASQLRRTYPRPFSHSRGPRGYRIDPQHRDTQRAQPRPAALFELLRSEGWVWVWPGRQGEHLSTDEFNRVQAFRIDHPDSYPKLPA